MIYYFSGTGNSEYVARRIGSDIGEKICRMTEFSPLDKVEGDSIGLVFPVHAWGPAIPVIHFIEKMNPAMIDDINKRDLPLWIVMTCGDDTGRAGEIVKSLLMNRGVDTKGMWSVIMPNTYVLLPGFDIDSDDVERCKLEEAPVRIDCISWKIKESKWENDVKEGSMPRLKTNLVYPLFKKWGIFPRKWHVSGDCVGCGKCVEACPEKNMKMVEGKPVWGDNCVSCLGCYHACPRHAVAYGNITLKKGQYKSPIHKNFSV